jgi:hypothetical protein
LRKIKTKRRELRIKNGGFKNVNVKGQFADGQRCEGIEIERDSPLLASPQGGVAASSRKFRVATELDAAGVVYLFVFIGKPPLLAVVQGGD